MRYTAGEEAANVATHAAGLAASVVGSGVLVYLGMARGQMLHVASAGVYGATLARCLFSTQACASANSPSGEPRRSYASQAASVPNSK